MKYDFKTIEKKWQERWKNSDENNASVNSSKPKHYNLVEFPYPSGAGLHVGHIMGYGASDAYCRMKRMQGYNVLFPIGWDAFGLPTENYAIKNKIHPRAVVDQNIKTFIKQFKSLGLSFDWSREIDTTDPDYYRWTQWIFLQFYKHAIIDGKLVEVADDDVTTPRLAYQDKIAINWCPSCKIGLANEEVINGKCERCGAETSKKMQKQWMMRITEYADRLIDDLDTVKYLDKIKTQQINWIGRSEGTEIDFKIKDMNEIIKVFTTRADTLFGCTYMVLSPEHELIEKLESKVQNIEEIKKYISNANKKSDLERTELQKDKSGVKLDGITAINPINGDEVEVWIADYVLANYGTGAVMAVPAHDDRDFEFAKKYNIDIKEVIRPKGKDSNLKVKAYTDYGVLINSSEFDGLKSKEAIKKITQRLKDNHNGDFTKTFKLRDWVFSRQHYWGEPIPIIHCNTCGMVPMDEKDLPLELPDVKNYEPTDTGESPLAKIDDWVNTKCPKCGADARRETDTMPNWAGSSWYFLRYCDPKNNDEFISKKMLNKWMPIDLYNGGMEHTTLHLLYSRFWHKFLYDLGVVNTSEPYKKRIAHGIILGPDNQKMSKSKGNVINPDEMIKEYGADTLRAYIMFVGPYDQESAWNMDGVAGVYRFLNKIARNFDKKEEKVKDSSETIKLLHKLVKGVTADIEKYYLNTYIAKLMEFNNHLSTLERVSVNTLSIYAKLLMPACPHLASELLEKLEVESQSWPKYDESKIKDEKITLVVQINGKIRDRISVPASISKEEMIKVAKSSEKVLGWIKKSQIIKEIAVPGKLVNIVTKD